MNGNNGEKMWTNDEKSKKGQNKFLAFFRFIFDEDVLFADGWIGDGIGEKFIWCKKCDKNGSHFDAPNSVAEKCGNFREINQLNFSLLRGKWKI